jgi:hypothetical protein
LFSTAIVPGTIRQTLSSAEKFNPKGLEETLQMIEHIFEMKVESQSVVQHAGGCGKGTR